MAINTLKYWKEAASVILAARIKSPVLHVHGSETLSCNYKILMLERTAKSGFYPSAQVFPGGGIDNADFNSEWLDVFQKYGNIPNWAQVGQMLNIEGVRPPIMERNRRSNVPTEVAYRICAIRETFEESGILLLKSPAPKLVARNGVTQGTITILSPDDLVYWRKKIHSDAKQFLSLCHELQTVPDVWSLAEWSNWLTPSDFAKRRFDTMFYIAFLDSVPETPHDNKEIVQSKWVTPLKSLEMFAKTETYLPPPQVYELRRLLRFNSYESLFDFSSNRAFRGCERWLAVRCNCADGVVSLLPGDDNYPDEPVFKTGPESCLESDLTCDEHTARAARTNRFIFRSPVMSEYEISCTAHQACGQVKPVTSDIIVGHKKSKL